MREKDESSEMRQGQCQFIYSFIPYATVCQTYCMPDTVVDTIISMMNETQSLFKESTVYRRRRVNTQVQHRVICSTDIFVGRKGAPWWGKRCIRSIKALHSQRRLPHSKQQLNAKPSLPGFALQEVSSSPPNLNSNHGCLNQGQTYNQRRQQQSVQRPRMWLGI